MHVHVYTHMCMHIDIHIHTYDSTFPGCRRWLSSCLQGLLSLRLMLEPEVQQGGLQEGKMGVEWGEQGQGGTTSRSWSPAEKEGTRAGSCRLCPWYLPWSLVQTHTPGPGGRAAKEGQGKAEQAWPGCLAPGDEPADQLSCQWFATFLPPSKE